VREADTFPAKSPGAEPGERGHPPAGVDLAAAIDAFLSQPDLAPTPRAKYRQTLTVVEDELGDAPVTGTGATAGASPDGESLTAGFRPIFPHGPETTAKLVAV